MGHANLVYHGAGWMEGGLTASFEKLVLDVEMLQMMAETIKPMDVNAREIAEGLETIAGVPTGGHFFGTEHTLARYETAFYQPLVSNWQNYENWELAGRAGRDPARDQDLAGGAGNLRAAAARPRHRRGPRSLRRQAARGAAVGRSLRGRVTMSALSRSLSPSTALKREREGIHREAMGRVRVLQAPRPPNPHPAAFAARRHATLSRFEAR